MHGSNGKGSRRRREDTARVRRNWPWPDRPPRVWDESDPDHPRHVPEVRETPYGAVRCVRGVHPGEIVSTGS